MSSTPYYPIVYVRGYAGSQSGVEDTVADPYMGFNAGSTKLRQKWDGAIDRHIFESPLIRLMKDHGYRDAYADGAELAKDVAAPWKTVWIYRYYEEVSKDLGSGKRPEIDDYARGLGSFLRDIRQQSCGDDPLARADFKVYLVAHSMGGLVARCWLQNVRAEEPDPVNVEKVFTYATPHGGIDVQLIGNIPGWVRFNNTENFNEDYMRRYLKLSGGTDVKSLDGKFDPQRFFSLIGTNAGDYDAAGGWSRRGVGPLSDGLVQIRNAWVEGSPRAFVHRSHSGHYGIVNSEEGYQNMVRFFFGDLRVDGMLTVEDLPLPPKVQKAKDAGKKIRAPYHFEVATGVRGGRWNLHRRAVNENSAIYKKYDDIRGSKKPIHLFSTFLSKSAITAGSYMTFAIDLGVMVPEYEIDNRLFDEHFEGSYIFRDTLVLGLSLDGQGNVKARYNWNSRRVNEATIPLDVSQTGEGWVCRVPVQQKGAPGIDGILKLLCTPR